MSLLTGKVSDFLKIGVAAAGRGDLETVRTVLAEKPDWLLRVGSHGRTMLWEAAYRGRLAMVEWLLDQGGVCGYCFPADRTRCGSRFARPRGTYAIKKAISQNYPAQRVSPSRSGHLDGIPTMKATV